MSINWYFYSDTNASPGEIESVLGRKQLPLSCVQKLDHLFVRLEQTQNTVLFLKAHTMYNVYELCQELSIRFPQVYIILISPDNMENMKKAMLVGASNILRFSSTLDDISEVICQAQQYMDRRVSQEDAPSNIMKQDSRVFSIVSTKGGIGRTFLTVNLAAGFAKEGKKVAVIDGSLQFGDIAMFYDLKPKASIYEWVKEGFERNGSSIEKFMSPHECGVSILAAPPRPEFFEIIKEIHLETAILELRKSFDIILIDTSTYISEVHLKSLVLSDEILLLTTADLPIIRNSKLYLDTLQTINLNERVKLILNQDSKRKSIDVKRIEEILETPIYASLPYQESIVNSSINEGRPFILQNSRTPLSKGILQLTKQILVQENNSPEIGKRKKARFALSW